MKKLAADKTDKNISYRNTIDIISSFESGAIGSKSGKSNGCDELVDSIN